MKSSDRNGYQYSEDMFADSRMTFGEHLEELRAHLWRAIAGFGVGLVLSFFIGNYVLQFIQRPVSQQLENFYERRAQRVRKETMEHPETAANQSTEFMKVSIPKKQWEARAGGEKPPDIEQPKADAKGDEVVTVWLRVDDPLLWAANTAKAQREVGRRADLTTLRVEEAFMVYFKVCIYCGVVLSSPWIFYQLWSFVAAGLYPHEKKYVHVYLPFSLMLFLAGVAVCQFVVIPNAIEALLWFNEWIGVEPELRLNEWLGFAIMMPLIFGVAFQTPLVMLFLERMGVMTIESYAGKRRIAFFVLAILSAVLSPSVDWFSMVFLWVPLCLLYELGIWLCRWVPRPPGFDVEVPDSEEIVEA